MTNFQKFLKHWSGLSLLILMLLLATGCTKTVSDLDPSIHLALGNPSKATTNLGDSNNYLMRKPEFALSYNKAQRIPNWVSWQLNKTWLGHTDRQEAWSPDPDLPADWNPVTPTDYRRSGYDRGHMTPSADRTKDATTNAATFVMTNIVPQAADNNRGPWSKLEEHCRELVREGKELYIITGGYGQKKAIAKGTITVPARLWKIIVVLDQPGQGAEGVTDSTPVIAVDMPNSQGILETDWRTFITTVDTIEAATGYDFLSNVSPGIQAAIEAKAVATTQ